MTWLKLTIFQNVLIVDLDKKSFVRSQGDEGTLLPRKIEKALKTVLNMCRIDPGMHYEQIILAYPTRFSLIFTCSGYFRLM